MALSDRAQKFLQQSRRDEYPLTEERIRDAFVSNGAPIFEPLIRFQQEYGGYTFHAGLEPITFSLIRNEKPYPLARVRSVVEFEPSDHTKPEYYFDCAITLYQMFFALDEDGVYYEDYAPVAASFDKLVEHVALWNEVKQQNCYDVIFRDKKLVRGELDKFLGLSSMPEASDQFTSWFRNEFIYMYQRQGLTTLIVSEDHPAKKDLMQLK